MPRLSLPVVTLAVALTLSCRLKEIAPDRAITAPPTAAVVLSAAAQKYAMCDTYQDNGTVVTWIVNTPFPHRTRLNFSTVYTRSGQFRFEYRETGFTGAETRYVIWKNHDEVKSWWTVEPRVKSNRDIAQAISAATGVSRLSAYTIPSALMKEAAWKGRNWASPSGTYRISDDLHDGVSCFRIQRLTSTKSESIEGIKTPETKGKVTYWIRKDDSLLVRVDEETDFSSFRALERTSYSPRLNQAIPEASLAFNR